MSCGMILVPTILQKDSGKGQDWNLYSDFATVHLCPPSGYLFGFANRVTCALFFVVCGGRGGGVLFLLM